MQANAFVLYINDRPFLQLPYQAELTLTGPQNLDGTVKLNEVKVNEGWMQYSAHAVQNWVTEHSLQPTTDISL